MNLFSKYLDNGISCIPVIAQTGRAFFSEWEKYSERLPTQEEVDLWDKEYPVNGKYGIAAVMGPASGLICSDIDTDDAFIHKIVPKSPYGKRGIPGRASYFYKYDSKFKNISESKTNVGLRCNNQYTIIPRSLHRKTGEEYVWLGKSLEDLDRDELPELPDIDWYRLLPVIGRESREEGDGRNNRLKAMVSAAYAKGKSDVEIVDEIYPFDLRNGKLFWDPEDNNPAKNEEEARHYARRFVIRVLHSARDIRPEIKIIRDESEIDLEINNDKYDPRPLPVPRYGFLRSFVEAANASSRFDVSNLSVGVGLSILRAIGANRVSLNGFRPVYYGLGIAPSGAGKGKPMEIAKELLGGTNLLSLAAGSQSAQAFVKNLPDQPESIDYYEEMKTLFDMLKPKPSAPNIFVDTLNNLYTSTNGRFSGLTANTQGGNYGACWNPSVSLFGTTHEAGLYQSVCGYLGNSGLMPRFLIFDNGRAKKNGPMNSELTTTSISEMKEFIRRFFSVYPLVKENLVVETSGNKRRFPKESPITARAAKLLEEYDEHTKDLYIKNQDSEDAPYISRLYEHVNRVTLDNRISRENDETDAEDVDYGIKLVETCFENSQRHRNRITNSGRITGPLARVETTIKTRRVISRSDLIRATDLSARELEPCIQLLEDEGKIEQFKSFDGKSQRKSLFYKWTELREC